MDPLTNLFNALMADSYISQAAGGRIKRYEYPETGDVTGPYIIIDPLASPSAKVYGSNKPITEEYPIQIDVWSKDQLVTRDLSKRIGRIMREKNFNSSGSGIDEYDSDTGIFREARRYMGTVYTDEFEDAQ